MSNDNVVGINSKQEAQYKVNPNIPAYDSNGNSMVVGNKYEMYAPTAIQARDGGLGLLWADNVGFSFTYLGVIDLEGRQYIGTLDVSFNPDAIPTVVYQAAVNLTELFGACPLCPLYVAAKAVRPATDE